jgi:F-type H+-transporting ATPase subunit a
MEHHPTWIGDLVNFLLGWLAGPLLAAVGVHPHDPARPIPDHIATQLFIVLLVVGFFLWFRGRLSAEKPGGLQLCFEQLLSNSFRVGIYDLLDEIVGHHGRKYLAIIGTVGLYVLFCNAISLIPGFVSPTAHPTVPLGCAMVVFLYYNYAGTRVHGPVAYGKHFLGPVLPMAPLMLPIELVSHFARLLSLTVRLWVNMVVSELLYLTFLGLSMSMLVAAWHMSKVLGGVAIIAPAVIPLPFVVLHVFVAFLQAFVFTLLPVVYVGGAVAEEH